MKVPPLNFEKGTSVIPITEEEVVYEPTEKVVYKPKEEVDPQLCEEAPKNNSNKAFWIIVLATFAWKLFGAR